MQEAAATDELPVNPSTGELLPMPFSAIWAPALVNFEQMIERRAIRVVVPYGGYQFYYDMGPLKNANTRYLKGEIPFWNEVVAHPDYDEFWQSRNILPHLKNIAAPYAHLGLKFVPLGGIKLSNMQQKPISIILAQGTQNPGSRHCVTARLKKEIDFELT